MCIKKALESLLDKKRFWTRFKSNRFVIRAAGAVALASGMPLIASWIIDSSSANKLYDDLESVPSRHVAIVLGAKVCPDGTPSAILRDRLATALDLYRSGRVKKILVSGDHQTEEYNEPDTMMTWLLRKGVPAENIFLDHAGLRTLDTMQRAKHIFMVDYAVICTQQFHLGRSVFLATQAGIDAIGLKADRRRYAHMRVNQYREAVARVVAVLDTILGRGPKHMGDPISYSIRR